MERMGSLTRSLWELGNLLSLFLHDPKSFEEWRQSSKSERNGHFSAVNVILHAALDETFFCALLATGNRHTVDASPITRTSLKV